MRSFWKILNYKDLRENGDLAASDSSEDGPTNVTRRIRGLLDGRGIPYTLIEHELVFTSQQAAEARGTSAEQGAKALVVRAGKAFHHLVISGAARVDNASLRAILGTRRVRFANADELLELTGCRSGAVPPFGNLFGLPVLVDRSLLECEEVAFNAGSHTVSIKMRTTDLLEACDAPKIADFAASAPAHTNMEPDIEGHRPATGS